MPRRVKKALGIVVGLAFMTAFCLTTLWFVSKNAGTWGVPYFSYTTERGSPCTNNFTGRTCSPLTLADVELFSGLDFPDDTRVVSGTYRATHDYQLDARLEVPKSGAKAALGVLSEEFGKCKKNHLSPLDPGGLSKVCVLANDTVSNSSGEPDSRLYTVGTGLRKDGTRAVVLTIKSR